jgi:GH15 family glucan-1,4-alpha-glucosidase
MGNGSVASISQGNEPVSHAPGIGDYAVVGDCRSSALISRSGSVDWLCWPRFDSPSIFGALLDHQKGGHFAIGPAGPSTVERQYVGSTNVLETTFRTDTGTLRLTECMPVAAEREKRRQLWPARHLLRVVECVDGEIDVQVHCAPRPDYARAMPAVHDRGALGIFYEHGASVFVLRSEIPLTASPASGAAGGTMWLRSGERRYVSLVFAETEPVVLASLGATTESQLRTSLRWWDTWGSRCTYQGPYRAAVLRSALTLKLMSHAPSGALVAAPTTSLPETLGGVRNWDYRYCWLRDASLTLQALFGLGYADEAEAFLAWLLHATRLTQPELQTVYDVYGESRLPERELPHLRGFADSRPVRVGNDARSQLQLDVYGEVVDAVYEFVRRGGRIAPRTARMLVGLGKTVCRRWREPDEGIWEIRGGRRQHTYSKAMCWVALDRLLKMREAGHVRLRMPAEHFARERQTIRQEIERRGYNARLRSYVSVLDGDDVDASLLLLARFGYIDPRAPRMLSTRACIDERLSVNGLLYRYRDHADGLPPGEGAFGICGFWDVACRARQGDVNGATLAFEHLLSFANDVGLFAEETDPRTGAALGNFPQAFTHVGLIDAALTLEDCAGRAPAAVEHPSRPAEAPV